jgi:outer membrane lipoprotein carrier protein
MTVPRRAFALLAAALLGAPAAAQVAEAAEVVEDGACALDVARRVQRHYESVRDVRARFRQRTERVALGAQAAEALEASGEVVLAKPGRMRWSYETPEPSLVVSDGETLWVHDPQAGEVQELPLGPEFLSGAALQFLLGEGHLVEQFEVSARHCGEAVVELVLVPRRDAHYEWLGLWVDPVRGEVRETAVVDLLGNRTRVALEGVRVNTGPPASLFRFEAPPGTRVLSVPPRSP